MNHKTTMKAWNARKMRRPIPPPTRAERQKIVGVLTKDAKGQPVAQSAEFCQREGYGFKFEGFRSLRNYRRKFWNLRVLGRVVPVHIQHLDRNEDIEAGRILLPENISVNATAAA